MALHVRIWNSCIGRPVLTVYVTAVVLLGASFQQPRYVVGAIIFLGLVALTVIIVTLNTVHTLVNSQHDDLVARIAQLIAALDESDTPVPLDPSKPSLPAGQN